MKLTWMSGSLSLSNLKCDVIRLWQGPSYVWTGNVSSADWTAVSCMGMRWHSDTICSSVLIGLNPVCLIHICHLISCIPIIPGYFDKRSRCIGPPNVPAMFLQPPFEESRALQMRLEPCNLGDRFLQGHRGAPNDPRSACPPMRHYSNWSHATTWLTSPWKLRANKCIAQNRMVDTKPVWKVHAANGVSAILSPPPLHTRLELFPPTRLSWLHTFFFPRCVSPNHSAWFCNCSHRGGSCCTVPLEHRALLSKQLDICKQTTMADF